MISNMLSLTDNGFYSVGTKFYELWTGVIYIICYTQTKNIVNLVKTRSLNEQIHYFIYIKRIILALSFVASIFVYFAGDYMILIFFGHDYINSYEVFKIIIWASIFMCFGLLILDIY